MNKEKVIRGLFEKAGVKIFPGSNGFTRKHDIRLLGFEIEVWFEKIYNDPFLYFGESYIYGEWVCDDLPTLLEKLFSSDLIDFFKLPWQLKVHLFYLNTKRFLKKIFTNPVKKNPKKIGQDHYDKPAELYQAMLGESQTYSCGLWEDGAKDLVAAQNAKHARACQDTKLTQGMHILDIGCGNGAFLKYAAENYGVSGVGITVSQEQAKIAREICKGLPVTIEIRDYANLTNIYHYCFDAVFSFGMLEHVLVKNYKKYFSVVSKSMKKGGIFFLHTIASYKKVWIPDPFIQKYVFTVGYIPTFWQVKKPAVKYFSLIKKYELKPVNYAKTLNEWLINFQSNWLNIKHLFKNSDRFYRLWTFYLSSCWALFQTKKKYVLQVILEKE